MKRGILCFAAAFAVVVAGAPAFAEKGGSGNAASSKAVFSNNSGGVTFTQSWAIGSCSGSGFDTAPDMACTDWYTLFDLPDAIKTSTQGALEAVVSLECSLWTDSQAVAEIGFSGSGGSRAGIEVRVWVDGQQMTPENVVYCDRLQYLELTIPGLTAGGVPVTSTDPFVVGLFQRTKNAHAFHYYLPTPATDLHDILVEARGIIHCFKDGLPRECDDVKIEVPKLVDDGGGGTKAAIGKSTLVVEEHQNWRIMDDGAP